MTSGASGAGTNAGGTNLMTIRFPAAAAALALAVCGTTQARAGGFGIREQSAQGQGLGFAGAASGAAGASSLFWNPATVTMQPGWNSEYNASVIIPQATITPTLGTFPPLLALGGSGDIGQAAVVPSGATTYQVNDRLYLGVSSSAPFGLVTKPHQVWAGQTYSRSSRIFSANLNPVIGYKVTDWLSIAGGPAIEYFKLTLRQATGISPLAPSAYLKGDDWGVGYTVGATVTPFAGTAFGVGYRSSIHHELEGPATGIGRVRANLNTPDKVSVGLTQAITPDFRVNFGFEWDQWSRIGTQAVVSESLGVPVTALSLRYRDGFFYSVGAEYDWSPQLTLRGGVAYEQSPIVLDNRSTRLPDGDRVSLNVGASYRWSDKLSLNIAYSHLFVDKGRILYGPGRPDYVTPLAFAATVDSSVDIVSVGFRYRWDNPPVIEPRPLVRKY
jgi:long-chain fatty acid transport protein